MTLETPEFGTQMQLASPAKDCRLTRVHPKARMRSCGGAEECSRQCSSRSDLSQGIARDR